MEIKKSARPIIENIIAQYLPVAVGGLVLILAWLSRQLQLWQILLLLLGIAGLVFWAINQIAVFREKRKKGLTGLSSKALESLVREWINVPAWSIKPQPSEENNSFAYIINHPELKIGLLKEPEEPIILLLARLPLQPKGIVLSDDEWVKLSGQLSLEMARFGIEYDFVGKTNKIDTIRLTEPVVLDDSMTGFYFRSRVMFVVRAIILVREIRRQVIRQSEKSIPDKEGFQTE